MSHPKAWLLILIAALNSTIGNLLIKKSSDANKSLFNMVTDPWFLVGLVFYGANVLLFSKALQVLPVSSAYPVLAGVGFILLAGAANLLFQEPIGNNKMFGMVLIISGICFLSTE
jgi:undecaprenyl phosphate-alpha-L-ara4N flippase subunit ArnE